MGMKFPFLKRRREGREGGEREKDEGEGEREQEGRKK